MGVVVCAAIVGRATSPERGLSLLDALSAEPGVAEFEAFHAARADLLSRAGSLDAARAHYEHAAALTRDNRAREYLRRRAGEV